MIQSAAPSGALLARNTIFNVLGAVIPGIAALILVPYIVHGLGVARFSVLSIAWVVIAYLTLFDFGLGRATIQFVSAHLADNRLEKIPALFWTSLLLQTLLAAFGGIAIALTTPELVRSLLHVPDSLRAETERAFYALALVAPLSVATASVRGFLEANQRFGLVNIVKSVANSLVFGVPALGIVLGLHLDGIMVLFVASSVVTTLVYLWLANRIWPALGRGIGWDLSLAGPLLGYGGWVLVSSLVVPGLVYSDRFIISAVLGVSVLAYYTVPFEIVARLQIIPTSFGTVLFPAFSKLNQGQRSEIAPLFAQAIKYLLLLLAPVALILVMLAKPILHYWVGEEFASKGSLVLQLLAVGMVLNALANLPAQIIDAVGRPDLRAKMFMAYLPFYLLLAWILIQAFGIVGAAAAWTIRSVFDLGIATAVAWVLTPLKAALVLQPSLLRAAAVVLLFGMAAVAIVVLARPGTVSFYALSAGCILLTPATLWLYALDRSERGKVMAVFSSLIQTRDGR